MRVSLSFVLDCLTSAGFGLEFPTPWLKFCLGNAWCLSSIAAYQKRVPRLSTAHLLYMETAG